MVDAARQANGSPGLREKLHLINIDVVVCGPRRHTRQTHRPMGGGRRILCATRTLSSTKSAQSSRTRATRAPHRVQRFTPEHFMNRRHTSLRLHADTGPQHPLSRQRIHTHDISTTAHTSSSSHEFMPRLCDRSSSKRYHCLSPSPSGRCHVPPRQLCTRHDAATRAARA